jgi:hypothetical protein
VLKKKMEYKLKRKKARFDLSNLQGLVITLVIIAIVGAVGLQILADQKGDMTSGSAEYNATQKGIDAVAKVPEKLPMIVGVILGVVIIGIVVSYFAMKKR